MQPQGTFLHQFLAKLDRREQLSEAQLWDPRRMTPKGELKMPKFVQFHILDDGEDLDEIFWEGKFLLLELKHDVADPPES